MTKLQGFPMLMIALNRGFFAKVDDADFEVMSKFQWSVMTTGGLFYARRTVRLGDRQKTLLLHREIMQPTEGYVVDHINGNGLDCRRRNMRVVTKAQNNINKRVKNSSRTGIKGVRKHALCDKFTAEIKPPGQKRIYLGIFSTIDEAEAAYKAAASIHHGEFRREQ